MVLRGMNSLSHIGHFFGFGFLALSTITSYLDNSESVTKHCASIDIALIEEVHLATGWRVTENKLVCTDNVAADPIHCITHSLSIPNHIILIDTLTKYVFV